MSWYIHPSKQLRDDELPPELVVTNRDGSIEQAYVPYDASDQLKAENAKLRELVMDYEHCILHVDCDMCMYDGTTSEHCPLSPCFPDIDELHELGVEVDG